MAVSSVWLVVGCYLLGALVLTAGLWTDPAGRAPAGDTHDVSQFAWYLRYAATALSHGHLPALVTTALGAPQGVNLMWNTAFLLPGIVLSPVTLLAGPQVSLNLVLVAGLAGSAASSFWVLRRWGASLGGAALGGGVYGFCPAVVNSGIGHYNFVFAVLPPLIIEALLRILTGRGSPLYNGVWLGVLAAAQLFIGSELLADSALAGLVLAGALAASSPGAVLSRLPGVALGLGTSAAAALLICWYPLWVQFFGPLAEHHVLPGPWDGNLGFFVDAAGNLMFHTSASAAVEAHFTLGLAEYLYYLGWPLIITLAAAAFLFWHDLRVRTAAVTCAVLELLSLGGGTLPVHGLRVPCWLLPFHWVQGLPVLSELLPNRICILADGAAAAVLAFSIDRARAARHRAWTPAGRAMPSLIVALAVLPLVPMPYQTAPLPPVPAGYQAAFARLRLAPDARVLVVPVPDVLHNQAAQWQATTGEPGELIGGYFFEPGPDRQPTFYSSQGDGILYQLWAGRPVSPSARAQMRAAFAYWRPAAVVAVTREGSLLAKFLTGLLGRPAFRVGSIVAWRPQPVGGRPQPDP